MTHERLDTPSSQARKISLTETEGFDRGDFAGQVYIAKEEQLGFNALLVTVIGRHPRKRMVDTTRSYFISEGEGAFILNGNEQSVTKGDLIVIPPESEYEYSGEMTMLEFNISPDNSFKDEKLE